MRPNARSSSGHRIFWRLSLVALTALAGAAEADQKTGPKTDPTAPPSPHEVLQKIDSQLGAQNVNFAQVAARPEGDDKTLAPYFYVEGGDPEADRLPVKGVSVDAQIAGVIARVKVKQTFENNGKKPIEAIYVFPASTRAAVHAMRMKIGERTVEAKIDRKQAARETYEAAKAQGKRASLLEQQRPNVFTMNVANLMPGDRIDVELDYSELLVPEDSVYEFVFPTVVGPRYGGGADPGKDQWIANPYLKEGSPEPFPFTIGAHVEAPIAIKELSSPSHKVAVRFESQNSADVSLDGAGPGGTKDFILRYRLAGDKVETGVMLYPGEDENFFLMMMEPPRRILQSEIPPREYIFVLDVSGSMWGFPLDTAKALMRDLLGTLRETDYFNVVLFSGAFQVMNPQQSLRATKQNIDSAIAMIERQQGGGGTELMGGIQAAYSIPKPREALGISRSTVVVTDGYVGVEAQAFKYIREHLDESNLFAFGIGNSVNRGLIEGMARAGQGEPFVVLRQEKAREEAARFRRYIDSPVLSNVKVRFEGFNAYDVAPGHIPDVMAQRPVVVFGKYRGAPLGTIHVNGMTGRGAFHDSLVVGPHEARKENAPLGYLWARKWVQLLDDEHTMAPAAKEIEDVITQLGLHYTLLTSYTSFVAVDSQVVNKGGAGDKVNQPLPLPEGVSNNAVGYGGQAQMAFGHAYVGAGKSYGAAVQSQSSGIAYGSGRGAGGGAGYGYGRMSVTRSYAAPKPAAHRSSAGFMGAAPLSLRGSVDSSSAFNGLSVAEAPAPAAPPPVAMAQEKSEDQKAKAAKAAKLDAIETKPAAPLRISVAMQKSDHVQSPGTLLARVEEAVKKVLPEGAQVDVSMRLTVDASGRVTKIEWLGARLDPKQESRLRAALAGLKTAAIASGATEGTVEIAIHFSH